ncbi:MAG: diacylglycerol kinase family lipid kinase [Lachnospiraceae bacterium]|nr:diacylglycerol kinase family lipid kinase [Lachnospiraceae bacterium]MCI7594949.1 diacylglycerol kinase family lipid kinase [Lachnospiraceae bacterium]MDY3221555.1 diacylglycerol kinase family lipid kinase [Lachnospiraceae bacterium]
MENYGIGTGKRMLFVYNPKAGKAKIRNKLSDIIDVFARSGYSIVVHPTQGQGDAREVVKNREKGAYDLIVCSGGDGTLDEVVAGMMQTQEHLPVGYIPAGSTNDFAKSLGISSNMVAAAETIVKGRVFSCDIGRFNEGLFVYVAAFGMFTEVSYATDQQMKNMLGHMAYLLEGVKSLSTIKSYVMRIESEEEIIEGDFIFGMVTNSISVGGFKNITGKDVELDDGKFEVLLVKRPVTYVELDNTVASLVVPKFDAQCIQYLKTSCLRIYSKEKISWTLDGEFGGEHKEVVIENLQKVLPIIVEGEE